MRHHVEAWMPYDDQHLTLSAGPIRAIDKGTEDPTFVRRRVGFVLPPEPGMPPVTCYVLDEQFEQHPLLWDGDQA